MLYALVHQAGTIGPNTQKLVEGILSERSHPKLGYRSCLGILRLARRYGNERLEAACARALAVSARSFRHVDSILQNGLDWWTPSGCTGRTRARRAACARRSCG